jgi:hypothetical protein
VEDVGCHLVPKSVPMPIVISDEQLMACDAGRNRRSEPNEKTSLIRKISAFLLFYFSCGIWSFVEVNRVKRMRLFNDDDCLVCCHTLK